MGGGYFASLEPRASVCEPQKIPAKKSKNGQNALIWHLLHAGYFIYTNTQGTTAPTKGNRTVTILIWLFRIPYIREAGQWTGLSKTERQISVVRSKVIPNIPVRRNRNGSFIWLLPKLISGIFGIMKTPVVFICWCTGHAVSRYSKIMAGE